MKRLLLAAALVVVVCGAAVLPAQDAVKIRGDQKASVELTSMMQGHWRFVGLQKDSQCIAEADLKGGSVVIRENRLVVTKPNGDADVWNFTVDTANTPHRIDLTSLDSNGKVR